MDHNKELQGDIPENNVYKIPDLNTKSRSDFFANRVMLNSPTEIHSHDYVEIAFVEEGAGIHLIGNTRQECKKGDLFLINCSVSHCFIPDEDVTMVICNSVFLPGFFDFSLNGNQNFQTLSNRFLFRPFFMEDVSSFVGIETQPEELIEIQTLFHRILKEYDGEQTGYLELIRAYMIELLIFILRKTQSGKDPGNGHECEKEVDLLITRKVISYIEENFKNDITIGELSMIAFLSPAQFCRIFKQNTGLTVREFMQKTRIEIACRMLHDSNKTIQDIACSVGYQDIKYFKEVFKKITGNTPSKMREEMRKI